MAVFAKITIALRSLLAPRRTKATDGGTHTLTREVDPKTIRGIRVAYSPDANGRADAGEIVWTWVPYAENDGRGKDRPVLVIARESADRVYAVKLTSRSHIGDRDYQPIGSGSWDSQRRPSWVDLDQLYSVHNDGLRREASALDTQRFAAVAETLRRRYGWAIDA
ncbi:hypothetical protein FHX48_001164 [Microbacterium halimionae]|uniref:PemK-like, MazF-like toxin of type II toxin-antitoxin system n=1 Tax=Microbacterium halimionae TaxID=1526413 RepID=A0A7W3JNL3_9MICO|nr:type II toxin-antitoxin system PemK/MazF family toxin [Microbacterium halimionae]MBA8816091.1 hypothetical protein [Microbacterium halimionae]NII96293.1 hypothetical protein [Microbacterium halimionae]